MEFGRVLRHSRRMADLTQEEMAEKMNMSRPNISKLERNEIELKVSDAIRWFQITNMPEISAAMICGIDPHVLINLMNYLPHLIPVIGGFVFWLM